MKKNFHGDHDKRNLVLYGFIIFCIGVYIITSIVRSLTQSLFFTHRDRVNILFYGEHTGLYSLGINDTRDYVVPYFPDLKLQIPGGYGSYRVGSLGKLVKLEQKPYLFQRTFSLAASTFVDLYFYSDKDDLYYGSNEVEKSSLKLNPWSTFFLKGNGNFFDHLYVSLLLSQKNIEDFKIVDYDTFFKKKDDIIFSQDEFIKDVLGLFYQKSYRNEKKNVQLLYSSQYETAQRISSILEGNGIRVSDVSLLEEEVKGCLVKESASQFSATAKTIALYFDCKLEHSDTEVYDIIFELGSREEEWEL